LPAEPGNHGIGGLPEEKHTGNKENTVNNPGDDGPSEQAMFVDKMPGIFPALHGNDDFFKQSLNL
jgi:hypothetical protein